MVARIKRLVRGGHPGQRDARALLHVRQVDSQGTVSFTPWNSATLLPSVPM